MTGKFIPISQPTITQKELEYVSDSVKSGWVSSLGPYIDKFEQKFAEYCGVKFALTTSNGTVGLHLAMVCMGIGMDDEVIIPDLTFIATANAVKYTGATVVTADIDKESLCIDPDEIIKKITSKTKAIIPVHLYGHPANMPEITEIAKKYRIKVIEDAAEAHGAEISGQKVGSFGDCGVFSFYGNKIITTGEGGMITTNDQELFLKAKYLRDHSMCKEKRYWHTELGYNYRITNLQAALGLAQLERIGSILDKKNLLFRSYQELLIDIPNIQLNRCADWAKSVYWMICLENSQWNYSLRDEFMKKLKAYNIDSRPYFYPVSDMPIYDKSHTPVSHLKSEQGINLPSYFDLERSDVEFICKCIRLIITH
jgi:perosamine synthetase